MFGPFVQRSVSLSEPSIIQHPIEPIPLADRGTKVVDDPRFSNVTVRQSDCPSKGSIPRHISALGTLFSLSPDGKSMISEPAELSPDNMAQV
jgi:hypothetical protein